MDLERKEKKGGKKKKERRDCFHNLGPLDCQPCGRDVTVAEGVLRKGEKKEKTHVGDQHDGTFKNEAPFPLDRAHGTIVEKKKKKKRGGGRGGAVGQFGTRTHYSRSLPRRGGEEGLSEGKKEKGKGRKIGVSGIPTRSETSFCLHI